MTKNNIILSLIVPVYNEEAILENSIQILTTYMQEHFDAGSYEIVMVDDGSVDRSTKIIKHVKEKNEHIVSCFHRINYGLGAALQTGFGCSSGDYVIVLDVDLSYGPDHIQEILNTLKTTEAKVVVASPYMKDGQVSNVPRYRYILSKWANKFLAYLSNCPVNTLTGMVRGYDGPFIRNLSLRAQGAEINPEILYKAELLDKNIVEIPAHLSWVGEKTKSRSKLKLFSHTSRTLLAGFFSKPFLFFILPGILVLIFSLYTNIWMIIHFMEKYHSIDLPFNMDHLTTAFKEAYSANQHTFVMAFCSLILASQLLAAGMLSLQSKYYFEELFSLGTKLLRKQDKK